MEAAVETAATRAQSRPTPTQSSKSEPPKGGFVHFVAAVSTASLLGRLY
jgi:hypothetical protein